jgi:predicted ATP-grasp superfamily ATP-dependent carboligase
MGSSDVPTVLIHEWVTGGGLAGEPCPESWAAEGRAMRRAIAADFAALPGAGSRVVVTLDARWADDPGPWAIVPIVPGALPRRLLRLAREADYTLLIAPETTGILAALTRDLERAGARLLGSSPGAVELTGDKARLAEWFDAHGIATLRTRTIVPAEGLPDNFAYPAVLKPVDGAGSIDTFYLTDTASVPGAARRMERALLQAYHPGIPMSASFLVDGRSSAGLIGIGRQNVAIEDGKFRYLGGVLPAPCPRAEALLRRAIGSVPGLRGFVGVDFLWDLARSEAVVLEINPRPTTSIVGLTRLLPPGCLARAWLDACGEQEPSSGCPIDLAVEILGVRQPIVFDAAGNTRRAERMTVG